MRVDGSGPGVCFICVVESIPNIRTHSHVHDIRSQTLDARIIGQNLVLLLLDVARSILGATTAAAAAAAAAKIVNRYNQMDGWRCGDYRINGLP